MLPDYNFTRCCAVFAIRKLMLLLFGLVSSLVFADEVDDFIQQHHVSTFDCPDDSYIPQVNEYLQNPSISFSQKMQLQVHKAHWLICVGKYDDAQSLLEKLLNEPHLDKDSLSFASIHYQLGFIFDVQEKPQRCEFYRQSEQLAKDKFKDVYLSSQLGLITVCDQESQDISVKLGRLFLLLQAYTEEADQASLAHIHNNIGLLYSSIGQMALAAEQYEKSYQLGLEVYEEKNQVAPLISLITAYSGSGDYAKAKLMIDELYQRNLAVNTPLTNSWYHFAQSRLAYRTDDFEALRSSLKSWQVFLQQTSSQTMQIMHAWYTAALCLHDKNRLCVATFLQEQSQPNARIPARLSKHTYYIRFLVQAHLFLGNVEDASSSFEHYSNLTLEKVKNQQSSARVLGVAKLHNEIIGLESSLAKAEMRKIQAILLGIALVVLALVIFYFTIGRSYLRKLTTDQLTGLPNEQAVLGQIKKVSVPANGRVNVLGLFEIDRLDPKFGYQATEAALQQVADCLQQVTRERDLLGRVGSQQFIVCLRNIEEHIATEFFNRIQTALASIYHLAHTGEKIEIQANMHLYSSTSSFSDVTDVLAEIRSVLAKS